MRVLLDTNILIHREASRVINEDIGLLFNWLDRLGYSKCYHPYSLDEIRNYQDETVVRTMEVKLANYNELKTIAPDTTQIQVLRTRADRSDNDRIDTSILNELHAERVDLLITEDRGIHRKAKWLGIGTKVFKIDDFLEKVIAENPDFRTYEVLAVRKKYFGDIDINDPFFDSFKSDYQEFGMWFNRKSDNEAYVCAEDDQIKAFLYLKVEDKDENYTNIRPPLPPKKRLKVGTLKVISTGYKLGERFLKIVFDNAMIFDVGEIYVTIFDRREEQKRLIKLLEDWGFIHWGIKVTDNGEEKVYKRNFKPETANTKRPKSTYPFVSSSSRKFIVPIYPDYHTDLFPDSRLNNESPINYQENEPYRNAIKKVYISRSRFKDLVSGDIVVFYRTGGYHKGVVSTIGVIENVVKNIQSSSQFTELCRKRSVFTNEGLLEFWNYYPNLKPFVVNFLYVATLPMPKVNLAKLTAAGVLESAPRGFERLSDESFNKLLKMARADESYFID